MKVHKQLERVEREIVPRNLEIQQWSLGIHSWSKQEEFVVCRHLYRTNLINN